MEDYKLKYELLKNIIKLNIHPIHYSIGEELKDDALNIERIQNGTFNVYYSERNKRLDIRNFEKEEDALLELYNYLVKYQHMLK